MQLFALPDAEAPGVVSVAAFGEARRASGGLGRKSRGPCRRAQADCRGRTRARHEVCMAQAGICWASEVKCADCLAGAIREL